MLLACGPVGFGGEKVHRCYAMASEADLSEGLKTLVALQAL